MEGGVREGTVDPSRPNRPPTEERSQVSFLEQALWKRLGEAGTLQAAAQAWLPLQCRMIPGVESGVVVVAAKDAGGFLPAAFWPEGQGTTAALSAIVDLAITERRGIVQGDDKGAGSPRHAGGISIAYPVVVDDALHGVVAVELDAAVSADLRTVMRQLQWGVAWLRDQIRRDLAGTQDHLLTRTRLALDLVAIALEHEDFGAACRSVATELAVKCECDRVSLGFLKNGSAAVRAISHSAQFGKNMNLVRMVAAAMDEAIDQRALILFPPANEDEAIAVRAHSELAHAHGAGHIFTVPFFVNDHYVGAIVFERPEDRPFDQPMIDLLDCVAAVQGPILEEKRQNDRWIIVKVWGSIVEHAKRLLGPGYHTRKLAVAATVAVVGFFYFATGDYRVTASASIEGMIQRAVVASFDGYIKEAPARAGDTVEKDQILAALDDRDLALERLRWVTERQKRLYEYDRAVAVRDRAEIKIIKTQIEQTDAQIRLIDEQLARSKLYAPFDGLVIAGDLSQSIGAAVGRGEVLFEIAPLNAYRVILRVDEAQIASIEVGQPGQLLVSSLPHETFPFVVDKITPVARAGDGRTTFRVEARLGEISSRLRPGMEGVGKVDIDERRLIWIWTRTMLDWIRISAWRWLP